MSGGTTPVINASLAGVLSSIKEDFSSKSSLFTSKNGIFGAINGEFNEVKSNPDFIKFAPGLPKTRSGKIMRRILRKVASGEFNNLGDTSTLADPGVVDDLIKNKRDLKITN